MLLTTILWLIGFNSGSEAEMEVLIHAFIPSCLDSYNSLFTCFSKSYLNHLQVVQNAAVIRSPKPQSAVFCNQQVSMVVRSGFVGCSQNKVKN